MDPRKLEELLERVHTGTLSTADAVEQLAELPYEDLGFAKIDHHRALRRGFPEAIFGEGKTAEQIVAIVDRISARGQRVLVTRTDAEVHAKVASVRPEARYHEEARCITVAAETAPALPGRVAIAAAGTSDLPGGRGSCRDRHLSRGRGGPDLRRGGGRAAPAPRPDRDDPEGRRGGGGGGHGGRAAVGRGGPGGRPGRRGAHERGLWRFFSWDLRPSSRC